MKQSSFFIRYKLYHLLGWLLLFGLWYFLRYQDYSTWQRAFWITLIKVTDLAIMIYIANYVLIPKLLYKKHYGRFALAFITMIVTSSIIKMQILGQIMHNPSAYDLSTNLKQRVYDNVIPHFFLVMAGVAIKL